MTAPLDLPPRPTLPLSEGGWGDVPGARCGVAAGRIKATADRDDVVVLHAPGVAAAVTTASTAAAAPCLWTRARVPGPVEAVVVNAGNANAATGARGEADCADTAATVAAALSCDPDAVLVCSTGVIGVPLPMERLLPAVRQAVDTLGEPGARAARAILTTDLVPKEVLIRHEGVTVGGMAKGSGMIHPGMATMLAFLVTDAQVPPGPLQDLLTAVTARTFNAISVDGCMSTNDTLILQSTGLGPVRAPGAPGWAGFARAVEVAAAELARAIARDGEGATTLIEAVVAGTPSDAAAREGARAVVSSHLLKAAIAGRDPNWGRVVGALGAAGIPDLEHLDLDFAGVPALRDGQPVDWDEAAASAALDAPEIRIACRLPGPGLGRAWGCDLTEQYVRINADYRS
ncbi:MAG: bifunctional glutamate N-acetyltransferase/amino-acid acetyltransferase ArgJ [Alphaproteobacteria bacterium]|nr:bifunctional glutamate N-acetyltransferase/amino-acid acetyltransferase ArgJ [Alphaproteobacteria bacterium]